MKNIPKKIWFFWYQGFLQAPSIVKHCILSWKLRHPEYEIYVLDKQSVTNFIEIPIYISIKRKGFSYQEYANFVRLELLKNYGGIWIDASVYCFLPLKDWLNTKYEDDLFIFKNSFKGRLAVNWFIAACPKHYILEQWHKIYTEYFKKHTLENNETKLGKLALRVLRRYWNSDIKKTSLWLSYFPKKILKIYPYFIHHYLFNYLYQKDDKFKAIWDKTKKIESGLMDLIFLVKHDYDFKNYTSLYKNNQIPLIKLSHRIDSSRKGYQLYYNLVQKDFAEIKLNA